MVILNHLKLVMKINHHRFKGEFVEKKALGRQEWGHGWVCEVIAMQAWGPELRPPAHV